MVGGGDMEKAEMKKFSYKKECTVVIDVGDNRKIAAGELINFLSQQVGDVVRACVPKGPNHYEVTFDDVIQTRSISDIEYLECNGAKISARLLHSETVVVSFLHLPAYIRDEEIEERLKGMHIEILTPIYRRYYKGTQIADGTRYVRVKFPPEIKSLPYSMKFKTVDGVEYFRVLHNNQLKVCYNCMSDSHVIKDCPNIKCHFCKENGHYVKNCPKTFLCDKCGLKEEECECDYNSEEYNDRDTDSDTADCEMQADNTGEAEEEKVETKYETTIKTQVKKDHKTENKQESEKTTENRAKNTTVSSVNKDADNNETDNSRQRKSTRRSRLVKRPSDEELWSLVEKRKQKKRQAARMKDVSEIKGMDECEQVNIDKL